MSFLDACRQLIVVDATLEENALVTQSQPQLHEASMMSDLVAATATEDCQSSGRRREKTEPGIEFLKGAFEKNEPGGAQLVPSVHSLRMPGASTIYNSYRSIFQGWKSSTPKLIQYPASELEVVVYRKNGQVDTLRGNSTSLSLGLSEQKQKKIDLDLEQNYATEKTEEEDLTRKNSGLIDKTEPVPLKLTETLEVMTSELNDQILPNENAKSEAIKSVPENESMIIDGNTDFKIKTQSCAAKEAKDSIKENQVSHGTNFPVQAGLNCQFIMSHYKYKMPLGELSRKDGSEPPLNEDEMEKVAEEHSMYSEPGRSNEVISTTTGCHQTETLLHEDSLLPKPPETTLELTEASQDFGCQVDRLPFPVPISNREIQTESFLADTMQSATQTFLAQVSWETQTSIDLVPPGNEVSCQTYVPTATTGNQTEKIQQPPPKLLLDSECQTVPFTTETRDAACQNVVEPTRDANVQCQPDCEAKAAQSPPFCCLEREHSLNFETTKTLRNILNVCNQETQVTTAEHGELSEAAIYAKIDRFVKSQSSWNTSFEALEKEVQQFLDMSKEKINLESQESTEFFEDEWLTPDADGKVVTEKDGP